jgi:hypothetical protein
VEVKMGSGTVGFVIRTLIERLPRTITGIVITVGEIHLRGCKNKKGISNGRRKISDSIHATRRG